MAFPNPKVKPAALKSYRRFADFTKLLIAGFSAILFFINDKLSCKWLAFTENVLCVLGIGLCSVALMGFNQAADKLDIELDEVSSAPLRLSAWRGVTAPSTLRISIIYSCYVAAILLFIVNAIMFTSNPLVCLKNDHELSGSNTINGFSVTQNSTEVKKDTIKHIRCTKACHKAINSGQCTCK